MTHVKLHMPEELNQPLRIYMAENNIKSKEKAIIKIVSDRLNITLSQGLRNFLGLK